LKQGRDAPLQIPREDCKKDNDGDAFHGFILCMPVGVFFNHPVKIVKARATA
jgi:hypothetical protein